MGLGLRVLGALKRKSSHHPHWVAQNCLQLPAPGKLTLLASQGIDICIHLKIPIHKGGKCIHTYALYLYLYRSIEMGLRRWLSG